jgi:hypothetical protein
LTKFTTTVDPESKPIVLNDAVTNISFIEKPALLNSIKCHFSKNLTGMGIGAFNMISSNFVNETIYKNWTFATVSELGDFYGHKNQTFLASTQAFEVGKTRPEFTSIEVKMKKQ